MYPNTDSRNRQLHLKFRQADPRLGDRRELRKNQAILLLELGKMRRDTHLGLMAYLNAIIYRILKENKCLSRTAGKYSIERTKMLQLIRLGSAGKLKCCVALKWLEDSYIPRFWAGATVSRDTFRKRRQWLVDQGILKVEVAIPGQRHIPWMYEIDLIQLLLLSEALERSFVERYGYDALQSATNGKPQMVDDISEMIVGGHCGYLIALLFNLIFSAVLALIHWHRRWWADEGDTIPLDSGIFDLGARSPPL